MLVAEAGSLRMLRRWRAHGGYWVYLGKDVRRRRRVESALGAENRWRLRGRLHEAAGELRQPFLDFVAELGARQRDPITWWSTTLSWKVWAIADLFLLICYLAVAERLIHETLASGVRLLLIVEDPWLFRQLRDSRRGVEDVAFQRAGLLARRLLWCLARGGAARARWGLRVIRHYLRQRRAWGGTRRVSPGWPAVALYSYPHQRCLRGDTGWEDPFLPGLEGFLRSLGYQVVRFSPPLPEGFEREIAARSAHFRPLILETTFAGVCRALSAFWWPRWPKDLAVAGLPVGRLLKGERWKELSQSSLCYYRMFYECARRMLREGAWRWVVYPYENQPWEKLLAIAARQRGIETVGVQHSTLATFYMSYFAGREEIARMPLPDVICVAGPYPFRLLAEGGMPAARLRLTGSLRYGHLGLAGDRSADGHQLPPAPLSEILVAVPVDVSAAKHLLAALHAAFPTGGLEDGLRFHIRIHPHNPEITMADVPFPAQASPPDLAEAFRCCGLIIYTGSSIGVEAASMGRAAIRYRPALLLDMDPGELYGEAIPTCTDDNLREVVTTVISQGRVPPPIDPGELFAPPQWSVLEEIFGAVGAEHLHAPACAAR